MILLVQFLFLLFSNVKAGSTKVQIEKGYFLLPINPGVEASLSGSFGDIRTNHFHAGLDIRTGGVEGKSVYAAAAGYVSRIKIDRHGYGNALYITHPNGLTTVYGHLKDFSKIVKERLLQEQYAQEKWEVDLKFKASEMLVQKGEMVAISGNTDGSGGPHLHFEIRDNNENVLDPARFGFPEIKDHVSPKVDFITLKCLSKKARINGNFGNYDFPVVLNSLGQYSVAKNISVWGEIGFELHAYDKSETSPFRLGLTKMEVTKDGIPTYSFELHKMAFYNKLDMNVHTDYARMVKQKQKMHKAYVEAGNTLNLYDTDENKGVWVFKEQKSHAIEVLLADSFENEQKLTFQLNANPAVATSQGPALTGGKKSQIEQFGSFLKLTTKRGTAPMKIIKEGAEKVVEPDYNTAAENIYVLDLEANFATHYIFEGQHLPLSVSQKTGPNENRISGRNFDVDFAKQLYKPIFIDVQAETGVLKLHDDVFPLKGPFDVKWTTSANPRDSLKNQVFLLAEPKPKYVATTWSGRVANFKPKEFGRYAVLYDDEPPNIVSKGLSAHRLVFHISDNLSGVSHFECRINGEWVLMEYEFKNGYLWSEKFDDEPFAGEIVLRVTDNCQNTRIFKAYI